ncbi:hypothetical protein Vafri_6655 [Volvox africanus]|uniref:Uncharacterized protein n=1 Tax=Volvox africanus TaxID=51714 RepID=A0A8J4AYJ1_9CHLO|nr:hypothetical protein Vafri_6655 [Volvox africanus]
MCQSQQLAKAPPICSRRNSTAGRTRRTSGVGGPGDLPGSGDRSVASAPAAAPSASVLSAASAAATPPPLPSTPSMGAGPLPPPPSSTSSCPSLSSTLSTVVSIATSFPLESAAFFPPMPTAAKADGSGTAATTTEPSPTTMASSPSTGRLRTPQLVAAAPLPLPAADPAATWSASTLLKPAPPLTRYPGVMPPLSSVGLPGGVVARLPAGSWHPWTVWLGGCCCCSKMQPGLRHQRTSQVTLPSWTNSIAQRGRP